MGNLTTELLHHEVLQELPREKLETLIEVMYLAAVADGDLGADERTHFRSSIESLTDKRLEGSELLLLLGRFEQELARDGRAARLAHAQASLPEAGTRRVALALAIRMAAVDRFVRTSERELISELAEALGIDSAETADLVREIAG